VSHAFHVCVCVHAHMWEKLYIYIYLFIFINLMDHICAYVNLFRFFCSLDFKLSRLYVICLILKGMLKKLYHSNNSDVTLRSCIYIHTNITAYSMTYRM